MRSVSRWNLLLTLTPMFGSCVFGCSFVFFVFWFLSTRDVAAWVLTGDKVRLWLIAIST